MLDSHKLTFCCKQDNLHSVAQQLKEFSRKQPREPHLMLTYDERSSGEWVSLGTSPSVHQA